MSVKVDSKKAPRRPMSVKVDSKKAPRILSTDDAIKMKVEAELSDRQLFAVLR